MSELVCPNYFVNDVTSTDIRMAYKLFIVRRYHQPRLNYLKDTRSKVSLSEQSKQSIEPYPGYRLQDHSPDRDDLNYNKDNLVY